jgi:hypothetical protein
MAAGLCQLYNLNTSENGSWQDMPPKTHLHILMIKEEEVGEKRQLNKPIFLDDDYYVPLLVSIYRGEESTHTYVCI